MRERRCIRLESEVVTRRTRRVRDGALEVLKNEPRVCRKYPRCCRLEAELVCDDAALYEVADSRMRCDGTPEQKEQARSTYDPMNRRSYRARHSQLGPADRAGEHVCKLRPEAARRRFSDS